MLKQTSSFESAALFRQKLLLLYLVRPELSQKVIAWSLYDGTGEYDFDSAEPETPPYASALAAMRDGWRVIQLPRLESPVPGREYEVAYLRYEVVLEKWEEYQ